MRRFFELQLSAKWERFSCVSLCLFQTVPLPHRSRSLTTLLYVININAGSPQLMTPQHHLIWRRVVCAKDPCFTLLSHWLTFMFFQQIDTIDVMVYRKFVQNIFERNILKRFLLYLRGSLGLEAGFQVVPKIYLIAFAPSRQVGRYRWGCGISKCETAWR